MIIIRSNIFIKYINLKKKIYISFGNSDFILYIFLNFKSIQLNIK